MLERKFKHSMYFKGEDMTVKQFLDFMLSHYGDWTIYIDRMSFLLSD